MAVSLVEIKTQCSSVPFEKPHRRSQTQNSVTMKFTLILLIAGVACALAAPVAEEQPEQQQQQAAVDGTTKVKRGLSLGLGYHAPLLTHSHYVAAPTIVHPAPLISHAPLTISHAPLIAHHPVSSVSYHLPTYHSIHHF